MPLFQAVFGDKDPALVQQLQSAVLDSGVGTGLKIQYVSQSAEESLDRFISYNQYGPCYMFVDPFGYNGLSIARIAQFLQGYGCDCTFFFNYRRINPAIHNPTFQPNMEAVFGKEEAAHLARRLRYQPAAERESRLVAETIEILKRSAASTTPILCTKPFRFSSRDQDRTSHFLFHASKHKKGIERMREIMAGASRDSEDGVASFELDLHKKVSRQTSLFTLSHLLQDELLKAFCGRTLLCGAIRSEHFRDVDEWTERDYRQALLELEAETLVIAEPPRNQRPPGTFSDNVMVTFRPKET
jgi:three-Cys-motif partner protein